MRDFLNCSLFRGTQAPYQSVAEAIRDLHFARAQYDAKTIYYLEVTQKVSDRLHELGFITYPEAYLSVPLLQEELDSGVFGRAANFGEHDTIYLITTSRFRLRCAPAQHAPERHFVVTTVECPSPTGMVAEREQGQAIKASLKAVYRGQAPTNAVITPLLDCLNEHHLEAMQRKRFELAHKSSLEIWSKALELQKRLLNEFGLPYEDWQSVDGGSSLLVQLVDDYDYLNLSGDERLCMTASSSRGTVIAGFFEVLDGRQLKIGLARDVDTNTIAKSGKVTLDNAQIRSILARQEDAFRRLKFGESVNPALYQLLTDPSSLEIDRVSVREFWDQNLDQPQKDVVRRALAAKELFLVQGPPGTGKTTAIVEIVRQILNGNQHAQRVLVASQSNVAVNHALMALLQAEPGLNDTVVRIGREEKAGETSDLLLDQQLARWSAQVAAKSQGYIEKTRRTLAVDARLAECINLLEEYEDKQKRRQQTVQDIQLAQNEYDHISQRLQKLEALLSELQSLKQRTSVFMTEAAQNDSKFVQLLTAFEADYVNWGQQFLTQASEAARLSQRRAELQDKIERLQTVENDLIDQMQTATALVRETLSDMYHQDLADASAQRAFVDQHLTTQQAMALKLGRLQKVAQDWVHRMKSDTSDFTASYLERSRVIGATCIGIAAKGDASEVDFDWVIVDEAGRATHPELIVPLVRGRKLVLVGDHRQLPPILDRDLTDSLLEEVEISRHELETSLFQDLIERAPKEATGKLLVQYRMHPSIGQLISECFYGGELENGVEANNRKNGLSWNPLAVAWYSTHKLKHHEERREGTSFQNNTEVEIILKLLDRFDARPRRTSSSKTDRCNYWLHGAEATPVATDSRGNSNALAAPDRRD